MSAEWFLHRAQWWEIHHFVKGMRRRSRDMAEMTRWHAWVQARVIGSPVHNPEDLIRFRWEMETDQQQDPEEQQRQLQALLDSCRQHNKKQQP